MPITMKCGDCGAETVVSDAAAGRTARCPKCNNYVRVPGEPVDLAPARQSSVPVVPILGALALVAVACGVAWYLGFFKPSELPAPAAPSVSSSLSTSTGSTTASPESATGVTATNSSDRSPAGSSDAFSWVEAPANAIAAAGMTHPSRMLQKWSESISNLIVSNPTLKEQWQSLQKKAVEYFGVDVTNPQNLVGCGIDIERPFCLAVLALDPRDQPAGVVFSVGITNADAVMKMVRRLAAQEEMPLKEDSSGQSIAYAVGYHSALIISEKRAYFLTGYYGGRPEAELRDFVTKRAGMRDSIGFKSAMAEVNGPGELTAYVDLQRFFDRKFAPKGEALVRDLEAIVLKAGADETLTSIRLVPDSRLLRDIKPGAPCRDFMAKLERPVSALTISAADLVDVIQYFVESDDIFRQYHGSPAAGLELLRGNILAATGLSIEDWRSMTKGGSIGILLYKNNGMPPVNALCFVNVTGSDSMKLELMKAAVSKLLNSITASSSVFSQLKFSVHMCGDYLVFGNANDQIRALPRRILLANPQWEPQYGKGELLAIEYFVAEFGAHMNRIMPNQWSINNPLLAVGTKINLELVQRGNSVTYSTGSMQMSTATLSMVAASAIPSLLRSRMAANETAAVGSCRAYYEAQEIYHRDDYRKDGVLQFAQSLKGDNSLLEIHAGKGDMMLIPKVLGEAEGNPSQNPVPMAGYCFKVLTAQGPDAPGGKRSYIVNERMTLGYALVAYPAVYDSTGRNTFMINHAGTVYQKDLGPQTAQIVEAMKEFNPDQTWLPTQ